MSLGIVAALGLAVYENPEIQRWIEEQRRRIAELLRSIGEELDPQSRRAAEAFAFEGCTPTNDAVLRQETDVSENVAAATTGRSLSRSSTVRRIPIQGTVDAEEMEERRRLGREYLAKRHQQMTEMHEKRKAATREAGSVTPPTPTSFDAFVDQDGKLKTPAGDVLENGAPSSAAFEPLIEHAGDQMLEAQSSPAPPMLAPVVSTSSGFSGFLAGSASANPFGDEYEMDRSETPKPPVPPKLHIGLERTEHPTAEQPGSPIMEPMEPVESSTSGAASRPDELSYDEQLAIALSLSEQEPSAPSATVRRRSQQEHDADLRAAIEASLRDMDHQQAAHAVAFAAPVTPKVTASHFKVPQPLVDLMPDDSQHPELVVARNYEALFEHPTGDVRPAAGGPPIMAPPPRSEEEEEEDLYHATPNLTRASLATLNAQQPPIPPIAHMLPYDPVHEAAASAQRALVEGSFYSAHDVSPAPPTANALESKPPAPLVQRARSGAQLPTAASSFTFESDADDSETFASLSAPASRAASRAAPRSEISHMPPASSRAMSHASVEVIDVVEDSDMDVISEDGIATPDSWTEIGSRDGESEDESMVDALA